MDGGSTRSPLRASWTRRRSRTTLAPALFSAGSFPGSSTTSAVRAIERQPPVRLSRQRRSRRAGDADVPLLAATAPIHHLQQDGAVAAHAGTASRLAGAAAGHVHILRAVEVPASAAGRLLRGRERGHRSGHDVVLRRGVPQLECVRLRRPDFKSERRRRRDAIRTTVVVQRLRRGDAFRSTSSTTFRDGKRVTERWDGRDRRVIYTYDRPSRALRRGRSATRAAARRELHQQQRTLEPRAAEASLKWSLKWLVWLQDLMLTYAFFV